MNVRLHIEHLVVDGLSPEHAASSRALGAAVERELAQLLAGRGLDPALASGAKVAALRAPPMPPTSGQNSDALGRRIARSVHGALTAREPVWHDRKTVTP
jgi:hypothetical protein